MATIQLPITAARRPPRRRFIQGGLGLLFSSSTILLACRGGEKEAGRAPAATQGSAATVQTSTPKRGGRFRDLFTDAPTFNPVASFQEGWILAGANVYDKLITQRTGKDTAREYVLEAAQSVEQPDPTTIIFKLKPGLKYQDRPPVNGRAVEAEDIAKFRLYVRDEPRAVNKSFEARSMQSVEAPDAQTVVFKLKAPNAYVFSGTQLCDPSNSCIVPRELLDNLDKAPPVGSGPYYLAEYDQNVFRLYRRNPGYREAAKGLPYIEEREYRQIVDPAAQETAFRSEQIMVFTAPFVDLGEQIKRQMADRVDTIEYQSLNSFCFSANVTRAPWNDIRVREAIYRFLNRQQYLDLLDKGKGVLPPGPMPVHLTEYQLNPKQTEKYFRQDLRAAKQLLDAAGFPFEKEVEMITIIGARNQQACEIFQQQAAQVGMKVRLVALRSNDFLQDRVLRGTWETWIAGRPAYDSPERDLRLQHTTTYSQHQFNGLRDPQVDVMIEKSEQMLDRNERINLIKDIQLALLEKYTPFIYLYYPIAYFHRYKYVRDYEFDPVGTLHTLYRLEMWLDR
jgi:peptide/nickel transport system substrate-binding protein